MFYFKELFVFVLFFYALSFFLFFFFKFMMSVFWLRFFSVDYGGFLGCWSKSKPKIQCFMNITFVAVNLSHIFTDMKKLEKQRLFVILVWDC